MEYADFELLCRRFAQQVQATVSGVLPGEPEIVSVKLNESERRFLVHPRGDHQKDRTIAVTMGGEQLAVLGFMFYMGLDRMGQYLKTVKSDIALYSTLDSNPLLRLEYRCDMHTDPVSHWQVHAERRRQGRAGPQARQPGRRAARRDRGHRSDR